MRDLIPYGLLLVILTSTCINIFSPSRKNLVILNFLEIILVLISGRYNLLFQGMGWHLITSGLLLGQPLFFFSLSLVRLSPRKAWKTIQPLTRVARHYLNIQVVLRYLVISGFEEILWRGTIQVLLGSSTTAVLATSVFFVLRHLGGREVVYVLELLDLFLFSCLLGILFLNTQSIYLVIVVHAVRNINLAHLRHARRSRRLLGLDQLPCKPDVQL